jgi:putative endonuclease
VPEQSDQYGDEIEPELGAVKIGHGDNIEIMEKYKQKLGKKGEDRAEEYLKSQGFVILARHYRYGHKEIDLVGKEGNTIVFIEVKTGRSEKFGAPEGWVSPKKQKNLIQAALYFIQKEDIAGCDFRFDVLAISLNKGKEVINHLRNAFMVT